MTARLQAEKAALVARAELERLSLTAAWIDVHHAVMPPVDPVRAARTHPIASRLLRIAIPVLGRSRAGRIVQMLSVGLTAYRIVRGLR